jgi:hypothetical protein
MRVAQLGYGHQWTGVLAVEQLVAYPRPVGRDPIQQLEAGLLRQARAIGDEPGKARVLLEQPTGTLAAAEAPQRLRGPSRLVTSPASQRSTACARTSSVASVGTAISTSSVARASASARPAPSAPSACARRVRYARRANGAMRLAAPRVRSASSSSVALGSAGALSGTSVVVTRSHQSGRSS